MPQLHRFLILKNYIMYIGLFFIDHRNISQVKIQFNPQKIATKKVSELIPVGASVLYNILKVHQSWKMASKLAAETF